MKEKYVVYTRAYNERANLCVTNLTTVEWKSNEESLTASNQIKENLSFGLSGITSQQSFELQKAVVDGNALSNPKYDMLFVYDGVTVSQSSDPSIYLLHDKFRRLKSSPWLEYEHVGSLQAAMTKANALAAKIGIDNVRIAKEVDLSEYIDIV